MVERARFVEKLGFDWISLSEHHYSPRILTPSPPLSAAFLASQVDTIKIALLGPIVPVSNPIRVAEELAMLDTMLPGRFVFGLLRGTTNEYLSYDLNPKEARERTDEGMELILRAWSEPQPFGWQGRYFKYRTVSIWPRPQTQPYPRDLCARGQRRGGRFRRPPPLGLGVSYGNFALMAQGDRLLPPALRRIRLGAGAGRHHLARQHDPGRDRRGGRRGAGAAQRQFAGAVPDHRRVARRADRAGQAQCRRRTTPGQCRRRAADQLLRRPGPDHRADPTAREEIGVGVLDLSLADPGTGGTDAMMESLDLFGRKVLPRIREI